MHAALQHTRVECLLITRELYECTNVCVHNVKLHTRRKRVPDLRVPFAAVLPLMWCSCVSMFIFYTHERGIRAQAEFVSQSVKVTCDVCESNSLANPRNASNIIAFVIIIDEFEFNKLDWTGGVTCKDVDTFTFWHHLYSISRVLHMFESLVFLIFSVRKNSVPPNPLISPFVSVKVQEF